MKKEILAMNKIVKQYHMGDEIQTVLKGIDLTVQENEFLSILGPSGSGKSTLMNIIGLLDVATSGRYILNGKDTSNLSEEEYAFIRNKEIGFIFQAFQLLPKLSALENVELPLIYAGVRPKERKKRAKMMLEKVGLEKKMKNYPNQLSGGQQQRVAIARALITEPSIILADEPTGALDQKTGHQILDLFNEIHKDGKTIIMITHDEKIAKNANRIVRILDGNLTDEGDSHLKDSEKAGANND